MISLDPAQLSALYSLRSVYPEARIAIIGAAALGFHIRKMTQSELARAIRTSRTVVHRLLDPRDTSVTLATLSKASKALGVKLMQVA